MDGSKKRKRDQIEVENLQISCTTQQQGDIGPALAIFTSTAPSRSTPFKPYVKRSDLLSDAEFTTRTSLLIGSSGRMHYTSQSVEGLMNPPVACDYFIGIRDKATNNLILRRTPIYVMDQQVKALAGLAVASSTAQYLQARNTLGETFGTKKAKAAIRAHERNRVDVSAMEGVASHLQDMIQERTTTLPTEAEASAAADSNRLIPPYDASATSPEDVYSLSDLIPDSEMNAISVEALLEAPTVANCMELLPSPRSRWVRQHIQASFGVKRPSHTNLKVLFYISCMLAFLKVSHSILDRAVLEKKLPLVPVPVLDGLLLRFAETTRGSTMPQVTPARETCLLTFMFALVLRLDDYMTDTTVIAHDLHQQVTNINQYFKSLGCKLANPGPGERERLGISADDAKHVKRAILRVPLEFPKTSRRRRA